MSSILPPRPAGLPRPLAWPRPTRFFSLTPPPRGGVSLLSSFIPSPCARDRYLARSAARWAGLHSVAATQDTVLDGDGREGDCPEAFDWLFARARRPNFSNLSCVSSIWTR